MTELSKKEIVRPTQAGVRARFAEADLVVPDECMPGVVANLAVLQDHIRTVRGFPLDDNRRIALKFEP